MTIWVRKEQEQEGTYQFNGTMYVTKGVLATLSPPEILAIYLDIQKIVTEKGGVDYLQIYVSSNGGKVYFIDQLNKEMIESGAFLPEDNHCTLLLPEEY